MPLWSSSEAILSWNDPGARLWMVETRSRSAGLATLAGPHWLMKVPRHRRLPDGFDVQAFPAREDLAIPAAIDLSRSRIGVSARP